MRFQKLGGGDAEQFYQLRRRALSEEPNAFGESPGEFDRTKAADWSERLADQSGNSFVIGAFMNETLAGTAGFYRESRIKRRHKGTLWGVYVSPEARGQRVSLEMIGILLGEARKIEGLEMMVLQVATTQTAARRIYAELGFRSIGVEPRSLFTGSGYVDEEHMYLDLRAPQLESMTAPEP
jgi:RimJ/RimL family protein N-acetyltransferase